MNNDLILHNSSNKQIKQQQISANIISQLPRSPIRKNPNAQEYWRCIVLLPLLPNSVARMRGFTPKRAQNPLIEFWGILRVLTRACSFYWRGLLRGMLERKMLLSSGLLPGNIAPKSQRAFKIYQLILGSFLRSFYMYKKNENKTCMRPKREIRQVGKIFITLLLGHKLFWKVCCVGEVWKISAFS